MPSARDDGRSIWRSAARPARLLLVFVALSVATRWLSLVVDVFDLDETAHIVGSWVLMHGGLLYTRFVDNKPPLLYVYYALAQLLAGRGLFAVHLVTVFVTVPLTALAVSAFFRHTRTGVVAAVVYLVYGAAFLAHDMLGGHGEILMTLPAAWALVVMRDDARARRAWRGVAAGVLIGVGVLLGYQIAVWGPALALAAFVGDVRRPPGARLRTPLCLAIGFILPLAGVYGWFAAHHGSHALVYWTLEQNFLYSDNPIRFGEALQRAAAYLLPFLIVTAPLWWMARAGVASVESRYRRTLLTALLIATIPAVCIGWRFFPHYFIPLYVPLALAASPRLERLMRRPLARGGRAAIAWSAAMLAGFTVANAVLYLSSARVYHERNPTYRDVAARLREDACARHATLFVWGYTPMIYYDAGLLPATRFAVMSPARLTGYVSGNIESNRGEVDTESRVVPAHWDWLMADLARTPPTFIVDTAPANLYRWGRYPVARYPRLQHFVTANYDDEATVDGVRIYRWRGCSGTGR